MERFFGKEREPAKEAVAAVAEEQEQEQPRSERTRAGDAEVRGGVCMVDARIPIT